MSVGHSYSVSDCDSLYFKFYSLSYSHADSHFDSHSLSHSHSHSHSFSHFYSHSHCDSHSPFYSLSPFHTIAHCSFSFSASFSLFHIQLSLYCSYSKWIIHQKENGKIFLHSDVEIYRKPTLRNKLLIKLLYSHFLFIIFSKQFIAMQASPANPCQLISIEIVCLLNDSLHI